MIMKMVTILIWAATTKLHGGWDHPPQGKLSIQLYYVNEGYIYIYIGIEYDGARDFALNVKSLVILMLELI